MDHTEITIGGAVIAFFTLLLWIGLLWALVAVITGVVGVALAKGDE